LPRALILPHTITVGLLDTSFHIWSG